MEARATAGSASGWNMRVSPVGDSMIGQFTGWPNRVLPVRTVMRTSPVTSPVRIPPDRSPVTARHLSPACGRRW